MKKQLLFIFCAFLGFSASAQIAELIKNGDFTLPNDAAKHLNINEITYWNSDDNTSNNTGREASGVAYAVNAAGSIYQVFGIVPVIKPRYNFSFSASIVWDGSANDTVYWTTYLSAFSGTDRTGRVKIDSVVTPMVCTGNNMPWAVFSGELAIPAGTANPGDSLVVEFDLTGSKKNPADANIWMNLDDVSLLSVTGTEIVTGGNMEDSTQWNFYWTSDKADTGTYKFNYTTDIPTEGEGGCLKISGAGQVGAAVWQPVSLSPGHRYSFGGAFKYASTDSSTLTWVELILSRKVPGLAGDFSAGPGDYMFALNSWMTAPLNNLDVDGTFQDKFVFTGANSSSILLLPDSVETSDWYIVIKAGTYNTAGTTTPSFTYLFDEVSLLDLGIPEWTELPINKVIDGKIDNIKDFTAGLKTKWDADSIYMVFDIVDDSITASASANIWDNDNVEIYFDITNSKMPNWPRTNGWPPLYTNGMNGIFQLRMVHDTAWSKYNPGLALTAKLNHATTADGYQFFVNIPWDTLSKGYVPAIGDKIGIDFLVSDNDASYRNQVSWNALYTSIWIDPASWGTLELTINNHFIVVPDVEIPTAPANLAAAVTGSNIALTWDASTDNIVVDRYIISEGTTILDTIFALQTGNTFPITGATVGSHTYGVIAMDVSQNKSAKSTVVADIASGLEDLTDSHMTVYPNPSTGVFHIVAEGTASVTLEVYNITGGLIASGIFTENYSLDLSKYNKGVYFLNLKSEGKTQVSKLIVQ